MDIESGLWWTGKQYVNPKMLGGLGLRDPLDINIEMGAKIWWKRITHEDEPWAKLWHTKYASQWPK